MAKNDKVINAVVVLKSGLLSLADIEVALKKGSLSVDVVEPNRMGDPAVLAFSRAAAPVPPKA